MDSGSSAALEERAARNQSLFRAVNEKLKDSGSPFAEVPTTHVVICECADFDCIETLELSIEHYEQVRGNPTHFLVLAGHVYADVERVVEQRDGYMVVEKTGTAAEVAVELETDAR
jgi:hypothetical protein